MAKLGGPESSRKNKKITMRIVEFIKVIRTNWLMYIRRKRIGEKWAKQIQHKDVSLISQNCLGGGISHDCGLRFNSPTVNMWIPASEFIELVRDFKNNINGPLVDITTDEGYPLGLLNGKIHIHFIHYKTFEDVERKWKSRVQRINYNDLRIIMTENDGCTYDDLLAFDQLPYKNKVVFTHRQYPEIASSCYVPGFESIGKVSYVMGWKDFLGRRNCDVFDWVSFINGR